CSPSAAAAAAARSPAMSVNATRAPSDTIFCAIANPSPEAAPVTNAILPAKRPVVVCMIILFDQDGKLVAKTDDHTMSLEKLAIDFAPDNVSSLTFPEKIQILC